MLKNKAPKSKTLRKQPNKPIVTKLTKRAKFHTTTPLKNRQPKLRQVRYTAHLGKSTTFLNGSQNWKINPINDILPQSVAEYQATQDALNQQQQQSIDGNTSELPSNLNNIDNKPRLQFSPSPFFAHIDEYNHQRSFIIDRTTNHLEEFSAVIAQNINRFHNPESIFFQGQNSQLLQQTPENFNILLYGDLGAGKTLFSRRFVRELTDSPSLPVPSPTFNVELTYRHDNRVIKHIDLYRLKTSEEAHIIFNHLPVGSNYESCGDNNESTPGQIEGSHSNYNPQSNQLTTNHTIQLITLIEWPHVIHNSKFMPRNYIRIDLQDLAQDSLKRFTISFKGTKFEQQGFAAQILNEMEAIHRQAYPSQYDLTQQNEYEL